MVPEWHHLENKTTYCISCVHPLRSSFSLKILRFWLESFIQIQHVKVPLAFSKVDQCGSENTHYYESMDWNVFGTLQFIAVIMIDFHIIPSLTNESFFKVAQGSFWQALTGVW